MRYVPRYIEVLAAARVSPGSVLATIRDELRDEENVQLVRGAIEPAGRIE